LTSSKKCRVIFSSLVVFLVGDGDRSWASVPGSWGSWGVPLGCGWWGSSVDWCLSVSLLWLWWVDGLTLVLDVSHEAAVVVGLVGHGLDAAVGKVDAVRS
jgi:hypothetical protein